jgi:CPA2 family monovalent cation:H+ antiporter-2
MEHDITLILTIAAGLASALLCGTITNRFGLSPIVGYLIAGILVGPHTPGFSADAGIATQLAEIGVILLMFGVGLHFHFDDLWRVRGIAVPGAIVQITAATLLCTLFPLFLDVPMRTAVVLGLSISVASTVVLIRVLIDFGVIHTPQGHAAVGWLIVEDLFTVIALVLLPAMAVAFGMEASKGLHSPGHGLATAILIALLKIAALVAVVLLLGQKFLPAMLNAMAATRSRELFTLTVLTVALGIAVGSSVVFGVSMALGAFLAGMVVSQSDVSHQAAADALPLRDAFAVLFFVSVGMLFDPVALFTDWKLIVAVLAVVLIGKPLAALAIVMVLGYSVRTGLTVALALAQIGEFSFILAELGRSLGFIGQGESSAVVACAIISITINPLLFRTIPALERYLQKHPKLWHLLNARSRVDTLSELAEAPEDKLVSRAVVVGFGPVGQTLTQILQDFGVQPVIIDLNVETVKRLRSEGVKAVYGDASNEEILKAAGIEDAEFLLLTLPDPENRLTIIRSARRLAPMIKVIVRARYLGERKKLEGSGADAVVFEEAEAGVSLAEKLLRRIGVSPAELRERVDRIREGFGVAPSMDTVPKLRMGTPIPIARERE